MLNGQVGVQYVVSGLEGSRASKSPPSQARQKSGPKRLQFRQPGSEQGMHSPVVRLKKVPDAMQGSGMQMVSLETVPEGQLARQTESDGSQYGKVGSRHGVNVQPLPSALRL